MEKIHTILDLIFKVLTLFFFGQTTESKKSAPFVRSFVCQDLFFHSFSLAVENNREENNFCFELCFCFVIIIVFL